MLFSFLADSEVLGGASDDSALFGGFLRSDGCGGLFVSCITCGVGEFCGFCEGFEFGESGGGF